ncbi:MAG: hypothetical protein ACRBB3_02855 [Alphaproteobacteria bacterium]
MSKILITSFEPFGLIGSWVRNNNASKQVMDIVQNSDNADFIYKTLPTSDQAIPQFLDILDKEQPTGILSMGEHLLLPPHNIKLEPFANDTNVSSLPLAHLFSETVTSDFVANQDDNQNSSSIGSYFCNQIYLQGINWAKENGNIPVAFIHVPVFGDHEKHAQQIKNILQDMQSSMQNTLSLDT